ncbi:MAG: hypothetical protein ISS57_00275 [Anaerolineales bacterium]|nr:hypothetical protein [Anaerolineales bacterium]
MKNLLSAIEKSGYAELLKAVLPGCEASGMSMMVAARYAYMKHWQGF